MTDNVRLTRPHRHVDVALLALGVLAVVIGVGLQSATVLVIAAYGVLLGTSTDVVSAGLEQFTGEALGAGEDVDEDTGWLIGKLENVIVLTLVLAGAWTALSIVFAAKSLIRREDISSGNTTYYLAGTLLNFTYTIAIGVIALWLLPGTVELP